MALPLGRRKLRRRWGILHWGQTLESDRGNICRPVRSRMRSNAFLAAGLFSLIESAQNVEVQKNGANGLDSSADARFANQAGTYSQADCQ